MKKNWMKIVALTLVLVLAMSALLAGNSRPAPVAASGHRSAAHMARLSRTNRSSASWQSNLLAEHALSAFGIKKELIGTVTFLDYLDTAPAVAWNLGKGASSRVKGWVEWADSKAHIYIAAKGGVNGEIASQGLFEDCTGLTDVYFNGAYHTETTESMKNMFHNCESLLYVDLETLDTSSATDMYQMFRDCYALRELDVSNFDTSRVKNMYCMFSTCYSLEELDLSNFNTAKVTNMGFMFSACRNLEYVDVSSFNTAKVTNMEGMFRWCNVLEEPDLSGWNVSWVRSYSNFMNDGMTINGQPWKYFFR